MMPWSGKFAPITTRIADSAARSAAVTGSNEPPRLLSSTLSEVRKYGKIASPATVANLSRKAIRPAAVMMPCFPAARAQSLIGGGGRPQHPRPDIGSGFSPLRPCGCHATRKSRSSPTGDAGFLMTVMVGRQAAWAADVVALVATLALTYMVSQFLRNSIGVIAPDIAAEMVIPAAQIGVLSSAFFFSFSAMH